MDRRAWSATVYGWQRVGHDRAVNTSFHFTRNISKRETWARDIIGERDRGRDKSQMTLQHCLGQQEVVARCTT